jgi:hypothetical protein
MGPKNPTAFSILLLTETERLSGFFSRKSHLARSQNDKTRIENALSLSSDRMAGDPEVARFLEIPSCSAAI